MFGVHFAEALEAFDLDAAAGDFEDAGEDFGDGENGGDLLFVALTFEQLEERDVVVMEDGGIDADFGEAGEDAGDGVGFVEFVEVGAAGRAGVGGDFLIGEDFVEEAEVAVVGGVGAKVGLGGEIEDGLVVAGADADHVFGEHAVVAGGEVVAEVAAVSRMSLSSSAVKLRDGS